MPSLSPGNASSFLFARAVLNQRITNILPGGWAAGCPRLRKRCGGRECDSYCQDDCAEFHTTSIPLRAKAWNAPMVRLFLKVLSARRPFFVLTIAAGRLVAVASYSMSAGCLQGWTLRRS